MVIAPRGTLERLQLATVRLGLKLRDGRSGSATAFFFRHDERGRQRDYLVTNVHAVKASRARPAPRSSRTTG